MSGMRLFYNDVTEWVIASSEADALEVMRELYGDPHYGANDDPDVSFREWPESKPIVITGWDDARPEERTSKTPREWIEINGRGLLCSTEY